MFRQEKLQGTVIVDDFSITTYKNGDIENIYYVLIALEFNDKKIGQISMSEIRCSDAEKVADFITKNVKPLESTLISDKSIDFTKLSETDYPLKIIKKSENNFPPVREVISYLEEKKLLNTLACTCSRENLSSYLNECCFKFNYRKSKKDWFDILLQNTV